VLAAVVARRRRRRREVVVMAAPGRAIAPRALPAPILIDVGAAGGRWRTVRGHRRRARGPAALPCRGGPREHAGRHGKRRGLLAPGPWRRSASAHAALGSATPATTSTGISVRR
jgi:hypothetical protein